MTSELLENLYEKTNIDTYFNQESPNKEPSFKVCKDRYYKQNEDIDKYNFQTNEDKPLSIRNQSNASDLQEGFAKNIDTESELKRINFYDDKCYEDRYKMDPIENKSLNQHYDRIFGPQESKLNTMKKKKLNEKDFIDKNCIRLNDTSKSFKECNIKEINIFPNDELSKNTQPVYYQFHNEKYLNQYPCQALFNNNTRRSGLPSLHNRFDINPKQKCYKDYKTTLKDVYKK
jgi:hypothetical protein